jgi:cleavage and polyadenylation specificity factor subunit 4
MTDSYSYNSIEFDFENHVMTKMLPPLDPADDPNNKQEVPYIKADPRHRIIVCQHWLLGLCQVGSECTYLHRFDKNKMPQCKHGKSCKIKNCPLKHGEMDVLECIFYRQGFCFNGALCHRRHVQRRPEECPPEATFEAGYYAAGAGAGPASKKLKSNQPNENYKVTLCTHWLQSGSCTFDEGCHFAHGEEEIHDGSIFGGSNNDIIAEAEIYDPTRFRMDAPLKMPFTQQDKISYFILQSPDLRSLSVSRRRGRWAVPYWIRDEINNAYMSSKHVIIFFSVRSLRGIYGVARMTGEVLPPVIGSPMSREFPVAWLRTIRMAIRTIAQMKVASSGMFIGKTTTDCKLDARVGLDVLYVAYRKPEWDWSQELPQASRIPDGTWNEYYLPTDNLHPDQLFADDWVAKVSQQPGLSRGSYHSSSDRRPMATERNPPPMEAPSYYTGEASGFVFCTSTGVAQEMLQRGLFALPNEMSGVRIDPAAPLFLLDMDRKFLFGVFQADCPLTNNLDPLAFTSWFPPNPVGGSPLPHQLRVQIVLHTAPISLFDPEYVSMMGKVHLGGELKLKDTKALTNLFAARAGMLMPGNNQGMRPPPAGHGAYQDRPVSVYRSPFKNFELVPVNVQGDLNEVRRRILGYNASNIIRLMEEMGVTKNQVRIRLRGIGSAFFEGPGNAELQEPMHFHVSAESESLVASAVEKIKALIAKHKRDFEGN